jgi:hypothetical protein
MSISNDSNEFDFISKTIQEQLDRRGSVVSVPNAPPLPAACPPAAPYRHEVEVIARIEELTHHLAALGYDLGARKPFSKRYIVPQGAEILVPIKCSIPRPWPRIMLTRSECSMIRTTKKVIYDVADVLYDPTAPASEMIEFGRYLFSEEYYVFQLPSIQAARDVPFILVLPEHVYVQDYLAYLDEFCRALNPIPSNQIL